MRVTVKDCVIHDVFMADSGQRQVVLQMNEEELFEMLDGVNPKNLVKYLDMRGINHREAPQINIYECQKQELGKRNRRKLDRCLRIIDSMNKKEQCQKEE